MLHGIFFSEAQSIPILHLVEIRWLKHNWFYFMGCSTMSILKQNSAIMNIQYKMSLHWSKCRCLGTSSDLSNFRCITLHLRWGSSVMLSQAKCASTYVPYTFPSRQGQCLPPALLIACLPPHLLHFRKSFSFCVSLSLHLWYLRKSLFRLYNESWIDGRS